MSSRTLFLSYARVDDEVAAVDGDRPGWVRYFHDQLRAALKQRVSRDLVFWRDVEDVEPDARFARDIEAALHDAMLIVAVVSPNYLVRPWCKKELHDFVDLQTGCDDDQRVERVVKILKHNVPENDLPGPLRDRGRGYKFFQVDPGKNIEIPYYMAGRLLPRHEQAYFDLINEIVERLAPRLRAQLGSVPEAPEAPATQTVFVSPPPASSSIRESYIALVAQLRHDGIAVLPKPSENFPDTLADAEQTISEALKSASMAIHLIGDRSGKTCDGCNEPMVWLQLRLVFREMQRRPDLRRLIWVPTGMTPATPEQAGFVAALLKFDAATLPLLPSRDDVVRSQYDAFLDQVQRTLRRPAAVDPKPPEAAEPASVYVMAADQDVFLARGGLRTLLRSGGARAEVPLPPDKPAEQRAAHETVRLRDADVAVVLWGYRDVAWVEDALHRLRNWRVLGRARPFAAIALLVVAPDDAEKDDDPTAPNEPRIDARAGLDGSSLAPLGPYLRPPL